MKKKKDNYISKILFVFLILYIGAFIYRSIVYNGTTNSTQISLVTTVGDNQGYHPKVISFKNAWNGYKYWMAFTPYPYGNEELENPVINASNDMKTWKEPKGIKNPIDVPEYVDSKHYNSDTHLLYNEVTNELEVFYRYVNDEKNEVTIYKMTTKDGVNYSDKIEFLKSNNRKNRDYVSPAIILENGIYKIWYVDKKAVYYLEINNSITSDPVKLKIPYKDGYYSWHIDVIHNLEKNIYEMITCAYTDINHRENMPLFYTYSVDNTNWEIPVLVLSPSTKKNVWDSGGLYRSSLLYENGTYYLFYSGHDIRNIVGIGLMYGQDIRSLKKYI